MNKEIMDKFDEIILLLRSIDLKLNNLLSTSSHGWGNGPKDIYGNPLPYCTMSDDIRNDK